MNQARHPLSLGAGRDNKALPAAAPSARRSALVVALVDDDTALLVELAEFVTGLGHQVVTFSSPKSALAYLERDHADVLISDVNMPELSGAELVKLAQTLQHGIAVALISGDAAPVETTGASVQFFAKPVDADLLLRFLSAIAPGNADSAREAAGRASSHLWQSIAGEG